MDPVISGVLGPATPGEVAGRLESMVQAAVDALRVEGLLGDHRKVLRGAGWDHVLVTTSYSGIGCAEAALSWIRDAFQDAGVSLAVRFHAATDISAVCRKALASHVPGSRPEHIFGNVEDCVPAGAIAAMYAMAAMYRARITARTAAARQAKGMEHASAVRRAEVQRLGERFLAKATKLVAEHEFDLGATGWCHVHERQCPLAPTRPQSHHALLLEVAGSTCVAWSSMGLRWGWLDPSAVPCLAWTRWMRARRPHIIIHENTPRFDVQQLLALLGPDLYVAVSQVTSPHDFGVPTRRWRPYTLLVRRDAGPAGGVALACWRRGPSKDHDGGTVLAATQCGPDAHDAVCLEGRLRSSTFSFDRQGGLARLFFSQPLLDASRAYLIALADQVRSYSAGRLRQRCFGHDTGETQAGDDEGVATELLIPPCARAHLLEYERLRAAAAAQGQPVADLVCLLQSPHHTGTSRNSLWAPPLLRNTCLYSLQRRRLVLPAETCLIQGIPTRSLISGTAGRRSPFEEPVESMATEGQLRGLLGNAMHLCQVGGASLIALCLAAELGWETSAGAPRD